MRVLSLRWIALYTGLCLLHSYAFTLTVRVTKILLPFTSVERFKDVLYDTFQCLTAKDADVTHVDRDLQGSEEVYPRLTQGIFGGAS